MTDQEHIGVGIEWHPSIGRDIMLDLDHLDCVEIIAENFFFHGDEVLDAFRERKIPVLVHAVEMSLGSADGFRHAHFERILKVANQVPAVNFLTISHGVRTTTLKLCNRRYSPSTPKPQKQLPRISGPQKR